MCSWPRVDRRLVEGFAEHQELRLPLRSEALTMAFCENRPARSLTRHASPCRCDSHRESTLSTARRNVSKRKRGAHLGQARFARSLRPPVKSPRVRCATSVEVEDMPHAVIGGRCPEDSWLRGDAVDARVLNEDEGRSRGPSGMAERQDASSCQGGSNSLTIWTGSPAVPLPLTYLSGCPFRLMS